MDLSQVNRQLDKQAIEMDICVVGASITSLLILLKECHETKRLMKAILNFI